MIKPMLCKKEEHTELDSFSDDWIGERKFDGSRIICVKKEKVKLYTRSGKEVSDKFPEIDFKDLQEGIYDGEIITKGGFRNTLKRINSEDKFRIKILSEKLPSTYMVFDILELGSENLRDKPLKERKEILDREIENKGHIKKVKWEKDIEKLWERIKENGGEGIIVKRLDSKYREGKRSRYWLKIKRKKTGEFQVIGYKKSDKRPIRSLILMKNGKYVGNVGTGFTDRELKAIKEVLDMIKTDEKPEIQGDFGEGEVVWLKIGIKAEIEYLEKNDKLRHPSFRRFLRKSLKTEGI